MNNIDLACKAKEIAAKKTLYCLGGFGQPLYKANQQKLIKQYAYNKKRKKGVSPSFRSFGIKPKRRLPDLNRRSGCCRPTPYHLAKTP